MRLQIVWKYVLPTLVGLGLAAAQSASQQQITNLDDASWSREKGAPADTESVMLGSDSKTGGIDLLVRYPAGHVIAPHFHDANERVVLVEGQLTLAGDGGEKIIRPGGFAFLPAHEVQRMSCSSKSRCTFYLFWDGKPASHAAK